MFGFGKRSRKTVEILPGRKPRLVALAIFLFGILLVLLPQSAQMSDRAARFLEHAGDALIVAAVLGYLLHATEMAEFFREVASQIMIERRFLGGLGQPLLRKLRSEISRELAGKKVDNAPPHEWEAFHDWTEALLFDSCLPGADATAGIYRHDYHDEIILHFMTLNEVIAELEVPLEGLSEQLKQLECLRYERITTFQVLAPRRNEPSKFTLPTIHTLPDFSPIDPCRRVAVWAGSCEAKANPVPIKIKPSSRKEGRVVLEGSTDIDFRDGIASVWKKSITYLIGEWDPFTLIAMSMVTHGVDVRVSVGSGADGRTRFLGTVIGLGPSPEPDYFSNGIRLSFSGWLLPDHGFFVHWWKESPDLPEMPVGQPGAGAGELQRPELAGPAKPLDERDERSTQ